MTTTEHRSPVDTAMLATTVQLAIADGEFRLNAGTWSGAIRIANGGERWEVAVSGGSLSGPVAGWSDETAGEIVEMSAEPDVWATLLSFPPPAPFTDVFGATLVGLRLVGPIPDAGRHLALRRFGDLLRFAANDLDPSPVTVDAGPRHGSHDAAVGRYVHLDIDGVDHRIYYESAGDGIPLLCQHTAGSDGRQWRHLLEDRRYTDRYRVISYDLPHHGKSLPPESTAWWAQPYALTKALAMAVPMGLIDALELDRPVFLGSSVGGMLALDLARYHAGSFRAVIACEAGLSLGADADRRPDEESAASIQSADPAVHAASMMSWMGATAPEAYRQETRLHYAQGAPGVFPGDINYFAVEHDLRGEAHLIDTSVCPVHLLTGEYDFVTIPVSEQAHREIAGSTYELMRGMGHFPMSEDPEQFAAYVLPILDSIAIGQQ